VPNHVISTDPHDYPHGLDRYADQLAGRSMWVRKAQMLPAECIVRGYLEGSALREYRQSGTVSGVRLPAACARATGCRSPCSLLRPKRKRDTM
jgi:phosphoribosylaminoimidazole-succinocarboxamide synthase